ncbi:MAG: hypothetical protein IPN51_15045 [Chloracidobacterium sp.]|nr:hypothetical protein [Chloracidobacterium sp.]
MAVYIGVDFHPYEQTLAFVDEADGEIMTLKIGDPRMIRRAALSRHKNDHRDAETILDLLMRGTFPAITPREDWGSSMK